MRWQPSPIPVLVHAVELTFQKQEELPEMTSVTNSSGLNYQNGINPLGRKVRALEADVDMLKKELGFLKNGGVPAVATNASANNAPSPWIAEVDALKRELATLKLAGVGKGEKGDKGDKGDKGEKGDPGPMTYIAMPTNASLPLAAPAATPQAP